MLLSSDFGDLESDLIGKVQILYDTKPTRTKNEVRFWHEVAFSYEFLNKHTNAPKNIVEVKVWKIGDVGLRRAFKNRKHCSKIFSI